jgi:hypothetical protein
VVLRPTDTGRALVKTVTARRRRELARIAGRLEDDELRRVADAFALFAAAAGEVPDEAWRFGWT